MMEVLLFPGVWHQPVLSACSGYQDAGTWIIAVCICPDYMDFVLFPHGKWKEIKQLLLQWVIVVCSRVAGWERVKLDVPWLGARTLPHCPLGAGVEPQGKVCVCHWMVFYTYHLCSKCEARSPWPCEVFLCKAAVVSSVAEGCWRAHACAIFSLK